MPKAARKTATRPTLPGLRVCIDNADYPESLDLHKIYLVVHDAQAAEDGLVRIIDETGEDYLYPEEYFVPIPATPTTARKLKGYIIAALAERPEGISAQELTQVVKRTARRKSGGKRIRSAP